MEMLVLGGGISGLATALALEAEARSRGVSATVRLFEADIRLGGKVDSHKVDGFVIERGVNGWLDSKPTTDALCRELGIYDERLPSNDASRRRFILRHGRLHEVPAKPPAFVKSSLMSWPGKIRLAGELWAKPRPPGDESLADFARRRLGAEALDALLDPMVSGIYAGNPEEMSLQSCFPRIAEIETKYGGLMRGMMKIKKERAAERRAGKDAKEVSAAGPGGRLISFASGTSYLIEVMARKLETPPTLGKAAVGVRRQAGGYAVTFSDGSVVNAEKVVLALPAYRAASVLEPLDGDLARELSEIPYAAVSVVALAWRREQVPHPLDGFGFVVPFSEGAEILGTLWDSSVFTDRAPDGFVLTRSMVGGRRRGDLALRDQAALVESVRQAMQRLLGVTARPELAHVAMHERAIPQYVVGHSERLRRIEARVGGLPGLHLTGNAYRGVGLNDCTAQAKIVARAVWA